MVKWSNMKYLLWTLLHIENQKLKKNVRIFKKHLKITRNILEFGHTRNRNTIKENFKKKNSYIN